MNITIKPFDEKFYKMFKQEKERIVDVLGDAEIEHVGSTAIPGLGGKNIVDILIIADSSQRINSYCHTLESIGYSRSRDHKTDDVNTEYEFMASRVEETRAGDFHLHIVLRDSQRCNDFLILKKYLLSHPDEARKYFLAKKDIAKQSDGDRQAYKTIKSKYVDDMLRRARKWNCSARLENH